MIQFIIVSSFFLQDYISFIFWLVFLFVVFIFGVVVFLYFISFSGVSKDFCENQGLTDGLFSVITLLIFLMGFNLLDKEFSF